jgi:hypothetical protein
MNKISQKHIPDAPSGDKLHPLQIVAWQKMSYEEKWQLASQANRLLRAGVEGRIRRRFPSLSEEEIHRETGRALLFSRA